MSELISVGVGDGVGDGVGVGVGVGVGDCADAGEETAASASANVTAIANASLRTSLISPDCDGCSEQRMNAISDQPAPDKRENHCSIVRFAPSCSGRSIAHGSAVRGITADCASNATVRFAANQQSARFPERTQKLANLPISCCNPCHNRNWPFDCAFREDTEIEQTLGSPFVAWHV